MIYNGNKIAGFLKVLIAEGVFEVEERYINTSKVKVKIAIDIPKIKAKPLLRAIDFSKRESETIRNPNMKIKRK